MEEKIEVVKAELANGTIIHIQATALGGDEEVGFAVPSFPTRCATSCKQTSKKKQHSSLRKKAVKRERSIQGVQGPEDI